MDTRPVQAHRVRHGRPDAVAEHRQHRRQHVDLAGRPARPPRSGGGEGGPARLAATNLGVPVASLSVSKGVVSGGGKTVTYGQLIGDKLFNVKFTTTTLNAGASPGEAGRSSTRGRHRPGPARRHPVDRGRHAHLRRERPASRTCARPDRAAARPGRVRRRHEPGGGEDRRELDQAHPEDVKIVHVGNVLGVVAPKEYDAIQAAAQLKVQWSDPPAISGSGNLWKWMRDQDSCRQGAGTHRDADRRMHVDAAMKSAAKTYSGTFTYHYQMHAPIGPNIARRGRDEGQRDRLHARQERLREHAAADRGGAQHRVRPHLRPSRVRAIYYEGASSFGGGAQHVDVGEAAAILSLASACRSGSSSCAGTSTAGTTTARPRCGTSRAESTRTASSSRSTPRASAWAPTTRRRPSRRSGQPMVDARQRPGRHDVLGHAVRHPEPPDHRQDDADAEQRVQDVDAAGAERHADVLRHGAGDRPAGVPGRAGSVPVPAQQHHHGGHRRRPVAVARRARRASRRRPTGSRGSRTRSSRPATSARVAASRSAASPARSPASWPRSR